MSNYYRSLASSYLYELTNIKVHLNRLSNSWKSFIYKNCTHSNTIYSHFEAVVLAFEDLCFGQSALCSFLIPEPVDPPKHILNHYIQKRETFWQKKILSEFHLIWNKTFYFKIISKVLRVKYKLNTTRFKVKLLYKNVNLFLIYFWPNNLSSSNNLLLNLHSYIIDV